MHSHLSQPTRDIPQIWLLQCKNPGSGSRQKFSENCLRPNTLLSTRSTVTSSWTIYTCQSDPKEITCPLQVTWDIRHHVDQHAQISFLQVSIEKSTGSRHWAKLPQPNWFGLLNAFLNGILLCWACSSELTRNVFQSHPQLRERFQLYEVTDNLTYPENCMTPNGKVKKQIARRIAEAQFALTEVRPLRRRCGVEPHLEGKIYCSRCATLRLWDLGGPRGRIPSSIEVQTPIPTEHSSYMLARPSRHRRVGW